MKLRLTPAEKMLALSLLFTAMLVIARVIYTGKLNYVFYAWNLFLAVVPVLFARQLPKHYKIGCRSTAILAGWLAFFPNAPYVITDIFHFAQRPGVPLWYDLLVVLSAAWGGLMAGFISLTYVDVFVQQYVRRRWQLPITIGFLFAASTGIYIGRYLRLNSWNVINRPFTLVHLGIDFTFNPFEHAEAWAFSVGCTVLLSLIYFGMKTANRLPLNPSRRGGDF